MKLQIPAWKIIVSAMAYVLYIEKKQLDAVMHSEKNQTFKQGVCISVKGSTYLT